MKWPVVICLVLTLTTGFADIQPKTIKSSSSAQFETPIQQNRFKQLEETYSSPPIDAKLDRVWHAIPGLNGWGIDREHSHAGPDGNLHLIWKPIPPKVRLSDLPAEPIYRGPSKEKSVSLMINVSWGEEFIPSLLDILKRSGVHATFFLDGAWVKKHPELAKSIVKGGHAIGSHGTGHPDFRKLSNQQLENQVSGSNQIIEKTVGQIPKLIAPPAGSYDARLLKIAHKYHMYTILWTTDTIDWKKPPADKILARAGKAEPGALILMHPTEPTVQALPELIRRLKTKGFLFKTLEDVVAEKPALIPPSS